ncbi:MAG: hypothetical protein HPY44_04410 [Armatimonadetes bacterium]|nr:hypothetical protein [Armatimonadota bacterium]
MNGSPNSQTIVEDSAPDREGYPLIVACVFAILTSASMVVSCLRATDGRLIYALDDAYIHLAISRTLAETGTLGVNAATPCAASSSPAWTLLLAGVFSVTGVLEWLPLALNLLAVLAIIIIADHALRVHFHLPAVSRCIALVAVVLCTPLGPLAMVGMEHLWHVAAVLALTSYALRPKASPVVLAVLAALATALRLESGFVVFVLVMLKLSRRDWRSVAAMACGAGLAVLLPGLWQMSQGHSFLANSLMVKGVGKSGLREWIDLHARRLLTNFRDAPATGALIIAAIGALWWTANRTRRQDIAGDWLLVLLGSSLFHLALAKTGWFLRYEAYLITLALVSAAPPVSEMVLASLDRLRADAENRAPVGALIALALVVPCLALTPRILLHQKTPGACRSIYLQQWQMARFLNAYYRSDPIAVNDLGAVAYMVEGPILDVWGLGSTDVADAMVAGRWDAAFIAQAAKKRGVKVAVVYDLSVIPRDWPVAATWTIPDQGSCYDRTICFRAVDPAELPVLVSRLKAFELLLPPAVRVEYPEAGFVPPGLKTVLP